MSKDLANIRVYGDDSSAVWVAPKGTVGPEDLATPEADFTELGWIGEDGITLSRSTDVQEFKAWQGGTIVRKKVTKTDNTFKFQCLEETAVTLGLMHPGISGSTTAGVTRARIPAGIRSDQRVFVVDMV
ncbi:hypothetical protein, partial [Lysinibacillus sp. NPDC056185]|uniref:phage tail tube protein n=1 Tax=Lysinibacillus sp. NPDC056185 TaxID=3345739 RepID=UPI0039EE52A4